MFKWPEAKKKFINEVLSVKNPVSYFENNTCEASGIRILLFDGLGNTDFAKIDIERSFGTYSIVNLADYKKTIVLDDNLWKEQEKGKLAIRVGQCVNFDSNIVSVLLKRFLDSQNENQELLSLMKYIKKKKITVSGSPYLLENSLNRNGMKNQQKSYKALLYYFTYLRINEEEISSELNNIQPNEEDYILADKAWHQMRDLRDNYINLEKRVKSIYCFLIKMFSIYYGTKKSSFNKLYELTDFTNERLGFYYEYGMMLAYWYFNNNETVRHFFEKVQPSSKDVLKKIENTAWDLFHLCNMPSEMAGFTGTRNAILLQSLITGDVSLAHIAKMNPISRMAFFGQEAQVKYRYSLRDINCDEKILNMIRENEIKRESMCEYIDLNKLAGELEVELLSIFCKGKR